MESDVSSSTPRESLDRSCKWALWRCSHYWSSSSVVWRENSLCCYSCNYFLEWKMKEECVQRESNFYVSAKTLLRTKDQCNLWSFVLIWWPRKITNNISEKQLFNWARKLTLSIGLCTCWMRAQIILPFLSYTVQSMQMKVLCKGEMSKEMFVFFQPVWFVCCLKSNAWAKLQLLVLVKIVILTPFSLVLSFSRGEWGKKMLGWSVMLNVKFAFYIISIYSVL